MDPVQQVLTILQKTFSFDVGEWQIEPTYWQAGAIIFLLFLLVFTLARMRYLYVHWSFGKQNLSFLFFGFLLTLILEGFLILSGRTLFTEIIGWKNAPKPISTALEAGRTKLVGVLGVTEEIPESVASETPTYESVVSDYQSLTSPEELKVRTFICEPEN